MKATRVTWTPGPQAEERFYADVFRIEISGYAPCSRSGP